MEVTGSGLVPQRLLAQAYSLRGHFFVPVPVEVTGLGLFQQKLLTQAYCLFLNKSYVAQIGSNSLSSQG